MLMLEVPWDKFLAALSNHMNIPASTKIFTGLKSLLIAEDHEDLVSIQEFGNVLKWFGPMEVDSTEHNFLARMQSIFTKKWFHGDISLQTAQTLLADSEPGTFLIRFSSNHPGSYALSKIIENQSKERVIVHIRISHEPGGNYSFVLDDKTYQFKYMEDLVKSPVLHLGTPCPGSKYYAQFRIKQLTSGYVNTSNMNAM